MSSKFIRLERESAATGVGAVLLAAIPLAIMAYRSQHSPAFEIHRIPQICVIVFLGLVLLRQFILRPAEKTPALDANGKNRGSLSGLALALVVTAAAYAPTIPLFFICDDFEHLSTLREPFFTSVWPQFTHGQFDGSVYIFYRPLGFASLFLDSRLWGSWAPGYHLTNLLLHLLCVVALFLFCREIGLNRGICTIAALLFGILPVNVQPVTWIACRFDQLATVFMLWSLLFAAQFRRTRRLAPYIAAVAFFFAAALSKESAYALPVLLIALEFLPLEEGRKVPLLSPGRLLPLFGYLGIAGVAFLQRFLALGGIGGYHESNGSPLAGHFGYQSWIGVLVRAPALMLTGNDTAQPVSQPLIILILLTAALMIALALLAPGVSSFKPIFCFGLLWIFVSILPAQFYFVPPFDGFAYARVLYFGSAALAVLLALLLQSAFRKPQLRRAWVIVLGVFLVAGLEQNITVWRGVSDSTRNFLSELKTLVPAPPPGTVFYIANVPAFVRATPFLAVGLQNAVRFGYGYRTDITAHELTPFTPASVVSQPNTVFVGWQDPVTFQLVTLGETTGPRAVFLNIRLK